MASAEPASDPLAFLSSHPSARSHLDVLVSALQRRRITGNVACAKATARTLLLIMGICKFNSTASMMLAVRGIGRLLLSYVPAEQTIGNVIRRILYLIREEYSSQLRSTTLSSNANANSLSNIGSSNINNINQNKRRPRANSTSSTGSTGSNDHNSKADNNVAKIIAPSPTRKAIEFEFDGNSNEGGRNSFERPPLALKLPVKFGELEVSASSSSSLLKDQLTLASSTSLNRPISPASPVKRIELITKLSVADLLDPSQQPSLGSVLCQGGAYMSGGGHAEDNFSRLFPGMRQNVIAAIQELADEIDTMYDPILKEAKDHVHADECILVYGYSTFVDMFLKGAARKRRYQVIIAEAGPTLEGHKLAASLAASPNISVTLIPDSSIYAIMCRVNKVIVSPHAVMADGGAICSSGHMMVARAAKDFSVPVVAVTGVITFTPMFAHNQSLALGELLSPASIIAYDADVNMENVEVFVPAYEALPPDLLDLYVTNNGSHQPSYIYRLLSEFYHPHDHDL